MGDGLYTTLHKRGPLILSYLRYLKTCLDENLSSTDVVTLEVRVPKLFSNNMLNYT